MVQVVGRPSRRALPWAVLAVLAAVGAGSALAGASIGGPVRGAATSWGAGSASAVYGGVGINGYTPRRPTGRSEGAGAYATGAGAQSDAVKNEGVAATGAFRGTEGTLASQFVADLDQLETAADAGNLSAARTAEVDAQEVYDGLRFVIGQSVDSAPTLDGLAAAVPPGGTFAGLHLVEQDLWGTGSAGPDLAGAASATAALVAKAGLLEFSLFHHRLTPQAIVTSCVQTLDWVNEYAVTGAEEAYSHLDVADVVGSVDAVAAAFADVEPLAAQVAPVATASVTGQLSVLEKLVGTLGTPHSTTATALSPAAVTAVADQVDVTADALSGLAPTLAGYGPRQLYGYNS